MSHIDRHRKIKLVVQKDDGEPNNRYSYQEAIESAVWANMDALILDTHGNWLGQRGGSYFLLMSNGHFSFSID